MIYMNIEIDNLPEQAATGQRQQHGCLVARDRRRRLRTHLPASYHLYSKVF